MKYSAILLISSSLAMAQVPTVRAEWDIAQTVEALSTQSTRLVPLVEQLTPSDWLARGASATFVEQWQTARRELGYLTSSTQTLQKQPEKLSVALETFFRLQMIETQLKSLADGVRTYQNPAVADLLLAALGENSVNRDHLQLHIMDLATQKEQEFSVVDREAQRCRAVLNRQAPPRTVNPGPASSPVKRPAAKQ